MKIIDFGATVSYEKKDIVGEKISSAFLPPEMFSLYSSVAGFAVGPSVSAGASVGGDKARRMKTIAEPALKAGVTQYSKESFG